MNEETNKELVELIKAAEGVIWYADNEGCESGFTVTKERHVKDLAKALKALKLKNKY